MNKKHIYYISCLAIIVFLCSCNKDEPPVNEPVSIIPSIELRYVSPLTVTEYEDSIVFDIFYQDGDGDLGFDSPDSLSLFVTDTRIFTTEGYYVQRLTPAGAALAIQGILHFTLDRTIMIDETLPSEKVQFQIQLKRQGWQFQQYCYIGFYNSSARLKL